jgi:transposase
MTTSTAPVIGGVDTHKHTHYAAVIDEHGRLLGTTSSPPTTRAIATC